MVYERINEGIKKVRKKCESGEYKTDKTKFTRDRKLKQEDFVWYLTMQKGRTTSMELDEYLKGKNGNYEIGISKQAFSKQRQYLKPEIFIDITKEYLKSFYQKTPEEVKRYKGYIILAIDGTMLEIPNTRELVEEYKYIAKKSENRLSARARVSGVYDVENGFMVNAIIKDCKTSEKTLCYENIEKTEEIIDLKKSIIIFDRGYPSMGLVLYLEEKGIKYICRLKDKAYKKEKKEMETNDEWVEIELDKDRRRSIRGEKLLEKTKEKKSVKVRMSRIILDTGEIEYLLSNVEKEIIAEEEMKEAYYKRWQIEIGYDILKNKLHIENFTGRSKITIEQDFYAQIYTYNLLQDIKNDANIKVKEENKGKRLKYEYKPNINILAGYLKNILIEIMFTERDEERKRLYMLIVEKAKKNLVAINPGRKFERREYNGRNKYRTNLRPNM